ncbi:FixH family protein (plasmid) [Microvirga sp. VF16]|nr:FixH family protein [Microvirga sp. VF16]
MFNLRRGWVAFLAAGLVAAGAQANATVRAYEVQLVEQVRSAFFGFTAQARVGDTDDYEFQLVERQVKQGGGATVTVRLVNKRTGKTLPDAVVFMNRLDMAPDGMADMTAPVHLLPDTLPGYYRFETDLFMAGGWALTLAAKLPDDKGFIQNRLHLEAVSE